MGVDQLERISSLKSLTHALGLDDKSVEEVISSSGMSASLSSLSVSSGRPASFASSIGDGYGVSRAKSVSKTPHLSVSSPPKAPETDIRHLSCLQYCQVTGESTCSESISAPKNATDSCSRAPSHSDMHFASSIRSQSVYLEEPSRPAARHRSSCSFLSTSTKASTFASCLHRKAYERGLEGPPRPHIAIGSIILENPAFAAINAGLAGLPFADLTFVCKADGWKSHAHSFILSSTCPVLLQKIQRDGTLDLDVEQQSSMSISSQLTSSKKSHKRWIKPQKWFRGRSGFKSPKDEAHHGSESHAGSTASNSFPLPNATSSSRPKRIQVTGCNGPDLRAFFFYLYTGQFRLVSSHTIGGADDTEAFRGGAKSSSSPVSSDCDEKAWDPTQVRKSRSLHSIFYSGKESDLRRRRMSSHTLLSLQSPSICTLGAAPTEDEMLQQDASQAPPFSVQGAYHFSQIFNLSRLAFASLSFFKHQLTLTNALQYYISPFSIAYPSIQSACLDYLVKNWPQVSAQSQTQTILGRLAAGWYPQANMALLQLLGKVE